MKKFITYLYRRYCSLPTVKTLYLNGIQRDFTRILSEKEAFERNVVVYNFLQTGWFQEIFNSHLKERVEALFNVCETQKQRDYMHDCINDLLKFEEKFKACGVQPQQFKEFDKHTL